MGKTYNAVRTQSGSSKKLIRLMLVVLLMMIAFSCGALVHASAKSNSDAVPPISVTKPVTIEVEPGDTLWAIATVHAPKNVSTRVYVDKLMKANGLAKADLKPGQLLILP